MDHAISTSSDELFSSNPESSNGSLVSLLSCLDISSNPHVDEAISIAGVAVTVYVPHDCVVGVAILSDLFSKISLDTFVLLLIVGVPEANVSRSDSATIIRARLGCEGHVHNFVGLVSSFLI